MKDFNTILVEWSTTFLRLAMHDFGRFTRNAGLSLGQMNVLLHLYHRGSCEVTNFCDMLLVTPAGASQMIERMVQSGVVQRSETPGDRRIRLVSLTPKGNQIVLDSIAARQACFDRVAESLTAEEQKQIGAALELLNEHALGLEISPSDRLEIDQP